MKCDLDEKIAKFSWLLLVMDGAIKPPPSSSPPPLEETLPSDLLYFLEQKKL